MVLLLAILMTDVMVSTLAAGRYKMDASRRSFLQRTAAVAGGIGSGLVPIGASADDTAPDAPELPQQRPMSKAAMLRARLQEPGLIVAPSVPTPEAAAIAAHVGHEAVYVSGAAMLSRQFMFDDWGMMLPNEIVEIAGRVATATPIPVITDADQAGETPLNTYRMVKDLIKADVAAAHIEDTLNPKHLEGHTGLTNRLLSIDEMLVRIQAAVDARASAGADLVIIARTDVLENHYGEDRATRDWALEEAIRRGNAYAEAGADVFMPDDCDLAETIACSESVPIPCINHGSTHRLTIQQVREQSDLKIFISLREGGLINGVLETMYRHLIDTDDNLYEGLALPRRNTYRSDDYLVDVEDYRRLAYAWIAARDESCNYIR